MAKFTFFMTPAAVTKAKELMEKTKKGQYLRVGVRGGGCSGFMYELNFTEAVNLLEDHFFTFDGLKTVIDKKSMPHLDGVTLDYEEGLRGKGFSFTNPNAGSSCGCRESFQPKQPKK